MIEFLSPISKAVLAYRELLPPGSLGLQIEVHAEKGVIPSFDNVRFAIVGLKENRSDINFSSEQISFDAYRKCLYSLFPGNWIHNLIDLGDIEKGETPEDSRFAAKQVVSELLKINVIPLILGAGQDLVYSQYRAYDHFGEMVNLVNIDSRFDLGDAEQPMNNKSYVSKMVVEQPYNLFNYSVIGFQSFYNSPQEISLMDKLYFDAYRLGQVATDITSVEPLLRNADIVTLDASAIKNSELSYKGSESPNGFDGREICAIARYAGMSNQVSSFGIYEIGKTLAHGSGAMLIAQILWYFVEGVNFRVSDEDFDNDEHYTTYIVPIQDTTLTFKKSNRSERWWMLLPFVEDVNNKLKRRALLPCTYEEYLQACDQQIPERWLRAYYKNEV